MTHGIYVGSQDRASRWTKCKRCKKGGQPMTIVRGYCDKCYFEDDSLQTSCAF